MKRRWNNCDIKIICPSSSWYFTVTFWPLSNPLFSKFGNLIKIRVKTYLNHFLQVWGFPQWTENTRDVCKTPMPQHIRIGSTFDLDIWSTDLTMDRYHLLIKDYMPTKFEASGAKGSWIISWTRLRDTNIPTNMCRAIRPSCFEGRHKKSERLAI